MPMPKPIWAPIPVPALESAPDWEKTLRIRLPKRKDARTSVMARKRKMLAKEMRKERLVRTASLLLLRYLGCLFLDKLNG